MTSSNTLEATEYEIQSSCILNLITFYVCEVWIRVHTCAYHMH